MSVPCILFFTLYSVPVIVEMDARTDDAVPRFSDPSEMLTFRIDWKLKQASLRCHLFQYRLFCLNHPQFRAKRVASHLETECCLTLRPDISMTLETHLRELLSSDSTSSSSDQNEWLAVLKEWETAQEA